MYESIVVPLDGSKNAEMVLPYVAELAARLGSRLALVSVAGPGTTDTGRLLQSYLDGVAEDLRQRLLASGAANITTAVLPGRDAEEIVRYATQMDAGLIALAAFGASGKTPGLLGNVANRVLWSTNRPVLVIRAPAAAAKPGQPLIGRIMVPLDGSAISELALGYARPLASVLGAEIVLFEAIEPVRYVPGFEAVSPAAIPQDSEEIKSYVQGYLGKIARQIKEAGLAVMTAVTEDAPADGIISFAESNQIGLIVMTTHGLSGLRHWVFGSTAEKVLHAGATPLLVIHPPQAS